MKVKLIQCLNNIRINEFKYQNMCDHADVAVDSLSGMTVWLSASPPRSASRFDAAIVPELEDLEWKIEMAEHSRSACCVPWHS
jgi:hypothetical protein